MNDIMNGFRCAGPWFDGKLPDDFATIKLSMCLFNCKYHHNLFWFWALTLETQRDDLCFFLLDGIFLLPITAPTRRQRELAREPLPTNRAKAHVKTSARNRARLLPPTAAIMSSSWTCSTWSEWNKQSARTCTARTAHGERMRCQHGDHTGKYRILICMWMYNSWYCIYIFMNTGKYCHRFWKMCIYFSQYRQIQANMNSQLSAYVPVCDFEDLSKVHIYFGIQANTE